MEEVSNKIPAKRKIVPASEEDVIRLSQSFHSSSSIEAVVIKRSRVHGKSLSFRQTSHVVDDVDSNCQVIKVVKGPMDRFLTKLKAKLLLLEALPAQHNESWFCQIKVKTRVLKMSLFRVNTLMSGAAIMAFKKFLNKLVTAGKKLIVSKKEYKLETIAKHVEAVLINAKRDQLTNCCSGNILLSSELDINLKQTRSTYSQRLFKMCTWRAQYEVLIFVVT